MPAAFNPAKLHSTKSRTRANAGRRRGPVDLEITAHDGTIYVVPCLTGAARITVRVRVPPRVHPDRRIVPIDLTIDSMIGFAGLRVFTRGGGR